VLCNDKWEEQYAEFEAHVGMHASNSVNARIGKETAVNKGGAVWSNRKARFVDCITSKNASKST